MACYARSLHKHTLSVFPDDRPAAIVMSLVVAGVARYVDVLSASTVAPAPAARPSGRSAGCCHVGPYSGWTTQYMFLGKQKTQCQHTPPSPPLLLPITDLPDVKFACLPTASSYIRQQAPSHPPRGLTSLLVASPTLRMVVFSGSVIKSDRVAGPLGGYFIPPKRWPESGAAPRCVIMLPPLLPVFFTAARR